MSVFSYQEFQAQLTMFPMFDWQIITFLDLGLVAVVILSVMLPAWRIIKQDPMQALREE
jgi:ABC-type lipoprotein release transport system permease subunit